MRQNFTRFAPQLFTETNALQLTLCADTHKLPRASSEEVFSCFAQLMATMRACCKPAPTRLLRRRLGTEFRSESIHEIRAMSVRDRDRIFDPIKLHCVGSIDQ